MKRLVLFLSSFLVYGFCHAEFSGNDYKTWRSTEVSDALTDTLISTVPTIIKDVTVVFGGLTNSTFRYVNSSAAISDTGARRSTSAVYQTHNVGDIFPIDDSLSQGFRLFTLGTATIRVRWDYEGPAPRGWNFFGLK